MARLRSSLGKVAPISARLDGVSIAAAMPRGRRQAETQTPDDQHARLAVVIRQRSPDQRQRGERQSVAVEHPLHRGQIGVECGAQPGKCHAQRRAVDEGHRGCQHARRQHDAAASRRGLATQRTRAWFGVDNAAAAWLDDRLRHASG